jgi:outer membrane protein assembly factor BamE (lipoprotein component of BamABCDE complex)
MQKIHRLFPLVLLLSAGCLVTQNSETTHNGTRISSETFAQIKPGTTTVGWVEATLGAPTSKTHDGDDEIWKYIYREHTDSDGAVFLIFGGSNSSDRTETAFVEFKDGVVTNKWRG